MCRAGSNVLYVAWRQSCGHFKPKPHTSHSCVLQWVLLFLSPRTQILKLSNSPHCILERIKQLHLLQLTHQVWFSECWGKSYEEWIWEYQGRSLRRQQTSHDGWNSKWIQYNWMEHHLSRFQYVLPAVYSTILKNLKKKRPDNLLSEQKTRSNIRLAKNAIIQTWIHLVKERRRKFLMAKLSLLRKT